MHICVDMQRLFAPGGPSAVPWAQKVLPAIEELAGKHSRQTMFDFTPVGAGIAGAGAVFLVWFYWLVPQRARVSTSLHEALDIRDYMTEAKVEKGWAVLGHTVGEFLKLCDQGAVVTSIMRANGLRVTPFPDAVLQEGDIILIEGDHEALDRLVAQAKLSVTGEPAIRYPGRRGNRSNCRRRLQLDRLVCAALGAL